MISNLLKKRKLRNLVKDSAIHRTHPQLKEVLPLLQLNFQWNLWYFPTGRDSDLMRKSSGGVSSSVKLVAEEKR